MLHPKYWLFHPDIYPQIKDDRHPDDIEIPDGCIFHYYGMGMVAYTPSDDRMMIHPHILPKYRKYAKQICLDSLSKMNVEIEALIPTCFRKNKIFAYQCGFKVEKIIKHNYLREKKWYDSILMVKK